MASWESADRAQARVGCAQAPRVCEAAHFDGFDTRVREPNVAIKAEYIWIDGTEPTARLRSKTKVLADGKNLPIWGFDGSSTNQAPGSNSDCVLEPVASFADPIRGGDDVLVMSEVLLPDMTPHATNTRALLRPIADKFGDQEPLF